jgi:hypothetical protein
MMQESSSLSFQESWGEEPLRSHVITILLVWTPIRGVWLTNGWDGMWSGMG